MKFPWTTPHRGYAQVWMLRSAWSTVPHSTLNTMSCGSFSADFDHRTPIHDAFATGTADRRAGYLAALGVGLLDRDILRMQVDERSRTLISHSVGILAAQIAVSRVEVDPDRRRIDQCGDSIEPSGGAAVLLVRLQPDLDTTRLGDRGRFGQHVPHQCVVFLLGGPLGLGSLVGVNNRRPAFRGKANRLFEILGADLRLAEWRMGGQPESFTPACSHARRMR